MQTCVHEYNGFTIVWTSTWLLSQALPHPLPKEDLCSCQIVWGNSCAALMSVVPSRSQSSSDLGWPSPGAVCSTAFRHGLQWPQGVFWGCGSVRALQTCLHLLHLFHHQCVCMELVTLYLLFGLCVVSEPPIIQVPLGALSTQQYSAIEKVLEDFCGLCCRWIHTHIPHTYFSLVCSNWKTHSIPSV